MPPTFADALARFAAAYWNSDAYDGTTNAGGFGPSSTGLNGLRQISIGADRNFDAWIADLAALSTGFDAFTTAAIDAGGVVASSSTSVTIGTGAKTWTVQTGKAFVPSMRVIAVRTGDTTERMFGEVTAYNSGTGQLDVSVTTALGSGAHTDWVIYTGQALAVSRRAITGADTVAATDHGALLDCAGTFSLAYTAAATLGSGFFCYVRVTSGLVTHDPNAAETIDGAATLAQYPAEVLLVQCDGAAFRTLPMAGVRTSGVRRRAITSGDTALAADRGHLLDLSGTFTLAFDAVATLGDSWFALLVNTGGGEITLDPNGAEQIDGITSYKMYPGEARLVQCDGAALRSVVKKPFRAEFTASDTFTTPRGYTAFDVEAWGAAGGGGSGRRGATSSAKAGGAAGGGGARKPLRLAASALGATETVTIGAGGTGGAAQTVDSTDGNAGTAGGNTSFGSLLTAYGGGAGQGGGGGSSQGGGGGGALSAATGVTGGEPKIGGSTEADSGGGTGGSGSPLNGAPAANGGAGGGSSNSSTPAGGDGGSSAYGGAGGGGGGAVTAGNADSAGGAGGSNAGEVGGGGTAGTVGTGSGGGAGGNGAAFQGGGGGGADAASTGGAGGDGGTAGGGGGGGASLNGNDSGPGGAGGDGLIRIVGVA